MTPSWGQAAPPAQSGQVAPAAPSSRSGSPTPVKTSAIFFPFDLFGSAGAAAGAELLADAYREMLADNRREKLPTRAAAYTPHVRHREFAFETLPDLRDWRRRGRQAARQVLSRGEFLFWVSG